MTEVRGLCLPSTSTHDLLPGSALASLDDTSEPGTGSGLTDKQPVLTQSCRISSVFRCTVLPCVAVQEPLKAEAGVCELSLFGWLGRSALAHRKYSTDMHHCQASTGVGSGCTHPITPRNERIAYPIAEDPGLPPSALVK